MPDFKTSFLVNRQVPEFIREEHPLFITFLEAYYEYLENKQGTQLNDLTSKAKAFRDLTDVDVSIDDFEQQFFNAYASLVSRDVAVNKEFLIKHLLPVYLAKGSENSFKLLFRMMFGQELEIKYPKNDVLRASDGNWQQDEVIKITKDISSYYTGTGSKKIFNTLSLSDTTISVYINDALISASTYFIRKEINKIYFNTAPANNAKIEIFYSNVNKNIFTNRKLIGETSGATALVESVDIETANDERIFNFFINLKTVVGTFKLGETILTNIFASDNTLINIRTRSFSSILSITLIDGGSSYNVGDPVSIIVPSYERIPRAFISEVFRGDIDKVTIRDGGAGFQALRLVRAVNIPEDQLLFAVNQINTTGKNTANTFTIFSNVISEIDPANTLISNSNYSLTGNTIPNVNVTTVLSQAFGNISYPTIGEISNVGVLVSDLTSVVTPTLNSEPGIITIPNVGYTPTSTDVLIDTFGSLGRVKIHNGGSDYIKGDELHFSNKPMSFGIGAEAEVAAVSSTGTITKVEFLPPKITGTANVTSASNVMVQGNGTLFTTELKVGNKILINAIAKIVVSISSNTSLNVNTAFGQDFTGKKIRNFSRGLVGGYGYQQDRLPTATVTSANGANANITVTAIMGDGEDLFTGSSKRPGEIKKILLLDPGKSIRTVPQIVLTGFGDGTALANATISPIQQTLPGRWTSSDSIISSSDRRIQGRDFYINYSYLLSSQTEFAKYKKIFKELLHPAGFKSYAELNRLSELNANSTVSTLTVPGNIRTLSGTVNVAGNTVVGTGTRFTAAANMGLISVGSYIAVNSEIRVVTAIISNTILIVSNNFTISTVNEGLSVLNVTYSAIGTETSDQITTESELVLLVQP